LYFYDYAVKYFEVFRDKYIRHSLIQEIKTYSKIKSKFLLQCFGGFYKEYEVGLIFEFMDGKTLKNLIEFGSKK